MDDQLERAESVERGENRLKTLESIERGDISVEEGLRRLGAPAGGAGAPGEAAASPDPPARTPPQPVARPVLVRIISQAVFWTGVVLVVAGGLLVSAVYSWSIPPGWQILGWVLFGVGVVVLASGWWMRTARWLSLRIREEKGTKINLAFPIPFGLVCWVVRIVQPFVRQLRDAPVDELILGFREALREGEPLVIDVHDEEDGDHVQITFV